MRWRQMRRTATFQHRFQIRAVGKKDEDIMLDSTRLAVSGVVSCGGLGSTNKAAPSRGHHRHQPAPTISGSANHPLISGTLECGRGGHLRWESFDRSGQQLPQWHRLICCAARRTARLPWTVFHQPCAPAFGVAFVLVFCQTLFNAGRFSHMPSSRCVLVFYHPQHKTAVVCPWFYGHLESLSPCHSPTVR